MIKKVTLIGSGNVASSLGHQLLKSGVSVVEVYSKTNINAVSLATKLGAQPISALPNISAETDLLIVAVKDDAIKNVVGDLKINLPIVHTSGSVGIEVFKNKFSKFGILYPLQTFTQDRVIEISSVPFFIESATKDFESELIDFSLEFLSENVHVADSYRRAKIHLAGVFSSNFTIQLLREAEKVLINERLPISILKPLVLESVSKAFDLTPHKAITGPAKRGDQQVIDKQKGEIKDEDLLQLYTLFTKLIERENHLN